MDRVEIQLQQPVSKNWTTMQSVVNIPYNIITAMESLKRRFPQQQVRAMCNGMLVNILP